MRGTTVTWMACVLLAGTAALAQSEPEPGFVRLFNGTLEGWEAQGGDIAAWVAEGDILSCIGRQGGWLRHAEKWSDYVLRFDYRLPPGGNSGIAIRFPETGNPAFAGVEIQLLDDDAEQYKDLKPEQYTGSLYSEAAAKRGAAKPPGEWNTFEVTCRGPYVRVVLNGQVINEVMMDEYTTTAGRYKPLSERPQTGFLGFQAYGRSDRVDFRNIRIQDLTTATPSGARFTDVASGTGDAVCAGAAIGASYTTRLADGTRIDDPRGNGEPRAVLLAEAPPAWAEGVPGIRVGGRRKLIAPAAVAWTAAERESLQIPEDATVVFDIQVTKLNSDCSPQRTSRRKVRPARRLLNRAFARQQGS